MNPKYIAISYEVNTYKDIRLADEILCSASFVNFTEALAYYNQEVKEHGKKHFIELMLQTQYSQEKESARKLTTSRKTIVHN